MSPLLPNMGPPIANTHDPIPRHELEELVPALLEPAGKAPQGRLSPEAIDEVARQQGKARAHAWAAMALDPNLGPSITAETLFGICVGQCQLQGAIPNLERLLELRDSQLKAGEGSMLGGTYDKTNQCAPWKASTQDKAHWLRGRADGSLSPFSRIEGLK